MAYNCILCRGGEAVMSAQVALFEHIQRTKFFAVVFVLLKKIT